MHTRDFGGYEAGGPDSPRRETPPGPFHCTHDLPCESRSGWDIVTTHGISSFPYFCSGMLYGIRSPTIFFPLPAAPTSASEGLSVLKVPTITESSASSSGQTSTPISHEAIRTSPFELTASPHACLDRFADVRRAQSMEFSPWRM